MHFSITSEQRELVRTVETFVQKRSPEAAVRRLMDAGGAADPAVWEQMASQLGLQGLIIPEKYGGSGFGFFELALVLEQTGAALLVAPLLSSVLATSALMLSEDDSLKSEYLAGIATGEWCGTVALAEATGRWDSASVRTTATVGADGYCISGTKMYVLDGQYADFYVVSARGPAGVGLFVVDAHAPGITVAPLKPLDPTRPQARLEFDRVWAQAVPSAPENAPIVDRVLATAAIALAAEQVGGAQRCLDMAVRYAKARVQFGRPIGSFQAVKHKCADMLLAVESARSAAYYGAKLLDEGSEDPALAGALAQAQCSSAYLDVAGENIQIHGGIGFTWEHPAHLYFRRAKSSQMLFGHPAIHRERLACLVGI